VDQSIAESTETWQNAVAPGWLNPEPAMKIDREMREKRRAELKKREVIASLLLFFFQFV
jgi:hypothetical protein